MNAKLTEIGENPEPDHRDEFEGDMEGDPRSKPAIKLKWWKHREHYALHSFGCTIEIDGKPMRGVTNFKLEVDGHSDSTLPKVTMTLMPGSLELEGPVIAHMTEEGKAIFEGMLESEKPEFGPRGGDDGN